MSRPSKRKLVNIFPVAQSEIFGNNFQKGDELFYPPSVFYGLKSRKKVAILKVSKKFQLIWCFIEPELV